MFEEVPGSIPGQALYVFNLHNLNFTVQYFTTSATSLIIQQQLYGCVSLWRHLGAFLFQQNQCETDLLLAVCFLCAKQDAAELMILHLWSLPH